MSTPEPVMATNLSAEDLALMTPALQEAEQAAAALQNAIAASNAAQGALAYVQRYLAPKYGLVAGDRIEADGTIVRGGAGGG